MNKEEINKIDKIISLILLLIAKMLSRYSSKYYNFEICKIEDLIKGDSNEWKKSNCKNG